MSDKHFLVEDHDTHNGVTVLWPSGTHKVEELERDLLAVSHHYHELGQRASALASERDAVAARLMSARADAESARRQLQILQAQRDARAAALGTRLESQQVELSEERRQREHLEEQLAQSGKRTETLLEQYGQEHQAHDSALAAHLDDLGEQLAASGQERSRLEAEQKSLASELEQARKVSAAERDGAREQTGALELRITELESEHGKALENAREFETSLTAAAQCQQSSEQRVTELEQTLREERSALEAELGSTREALTQARTKQQEFERHRSAANPRQQQQPNEQTSPHVKFSAGSNAWKTIAGASMLLGTVASATVYWGAAKDSQNRVLADTAIQSPARHSISAANLLETQAFNPLASLPPPAASAAQLLVGNDPDRLPIATLTSPSASRQKRDPDTTPATPGGKQQVRATGAGHGSSTEMPATLQSTARESLRSLHDPLAINDLELSGAPSIREQQNSLIALGFDLGEARADGFKGKRTRQALSEFQQYYLPVTGLQQAADDQHMALIVNLFADIARNDQQAFSIDSKVLAAIRLGSLRTGMEFPYLMELAYTESSFNPAEKARRSSATGLYQFTDSTWLGSIKAYGEKYGLGLYASEIRYFTDHKGRQQLSVDNPIVYRHILALRYNPRISALIAAEFALKNKQQLARILGPDFGSTELYLAHFFGIEHALEFLRLLEQSPYRLAAELFPKAAQSNPGVFEPWKGEKRTMQEVYDFFDAKFDTGRYEILNPGLALVQGIRQ